MTRDGLSGLVHLAAIGEGQECLLKYKDKTPDLIDVV